MSTDLLPRRCFLLVYSPEVATFEAMKAFLSSEERVYNWYAILPNTVFVITTHTETSLSALVKRRFGSSRPFFVVTTDGAKSGLLPEDLWTFMRTKPAAKAPANDTELRSALERYVREANARKAAEDTARRNDMSALLRAIEKSKKP